MTDIFTNSSGIHILIRRPENTGIVYYNLNSAGEINPDKTETFETSGDFPNIIGTNDKIYAIYKTGNNIRVRYSTDNGSSWIWNLNLDRTTTANDCNGVDAVYELGNGVHIVWATQDGGASGFETHYYRLNPQHTWVEGQNITNVSAAEYGGNPSVTVSPNRVHVSFNTDPTNNISGLGDVKTRDRLNGIWQDPQTVVSVPEQSLDERLLVRGALIYLFYSRENPQFFPNDLRFRTRSVDNTTGWSGFTTLETGTLLQNEDAFEITKTTNDHIHILYKKFIQSWKYSYKYYNGTNWITQDNFDDNSVPLRQIGLSSVSNDLFCTWVKLETNQTMRFRQYDAIPLAPQNLTITKSANNHPLLAWSANPEPDIIHYKIYRLNGCTGSWNSIGQSSGLSYEDQTLSYCTAPPPQQCVNTCVYSYWITAVDNSDNGSLESDPSNIVAATLVGGGPPQKIGSDNTFEIEYNLAQNFPNPFNPSTTISYSVESTGMVTLKVYDMLGTEVASLVNEMKDPGDYSVVFDGSDLPSGMYVYRLITDNFLDSKKLILLK